jgi:hypothetical protein
VEICVITHILRKNFRAESQVLRAAVEQTPLNPKLAGPAASRNSLKFV